MPDMSIRGFSDEEYSALKSVAQAANMGLEPWAKQHLLQVLKQPVIKERYAYRVYGKEGQGKISRHSDHPNGTSGTYKQFGMVEMQAFKKAEDLIRRNEVGDRERAVELLKQTFEDVVEVPV